MAPSHRKRRSMYPSFFYLADDAVVNDTVDLFLVKRGLHFRIAAEGRKVTFCVMPSLRRMSVVTVCAVELKRVMPRTYPLICSGA